MKKNILVAGGLGFIGINLITKLLLKGENVICLDNLLTSNVTYLNKLKTHRNFEFIRHDITLPLYIEIDQIFNLACPASPSYYQKDPVKTLKTNILGSINLLGLAKRTQAKILLASTSEIYGNPKESPQGETYFGNVNPIGIRSCYDEGKRCAETLFMDYYRKHKTKIKIVRIFNTYGPNMRIDDGRVISNFIFKAIKNKPIEIYGDGNQTRSFCYIDDLTKGIIKMMNSNSSNIGPINIGNDHEISIKNLAILIIKLCKSSSKIIYRELPKDDPMKRKPNITLAKKKLKWEPSTDLNIGLIHTINFFKKNIVN